MFFKVLKIKIPIYFNWLTNVSNKGTEIWVKLHKER